MKLAILQLSDLHIGDEENPVIDRAQKIKAALQSVDSQVDAYLIVVTGDVAFSGSESQYRIAYNFFSELRNSIQSIDKSRLVGCIFVPGNHDCDFSKELDTRPALIETISSRIDTLEASSNIVKECLAIQDEFFLFESNFSEDGPLLVDKRLYYEKEFSVQGRRIKFNCYNTAWLSRIKERQGDLFFPTQIAASATNTERDFDLIFSLFHHPYNWLEATSSLDFKRHVERTSDIILTGHEHEGNFYQKQVISGEEVQYTEGAVLQESGGNKSGFNILIIDLDQRRQKIFQYAWSGDRYVPKNESQWLTFIRNKFLNAQWFVNNNEFATYLADAGIGFTHPKKKDLRLRDLFIYPDFTERSLGRRIEGSSYSVRRRGAEVIDFILQRDYTLFIGSSLSGKTAFAKILYTDLQFKQLVPTLVSGEDIDGPDEDKFMKGIRRAFVNQYTKEALDRYLQLEPAKRVLIIDDFHKVRFNRKGQKAVLEIAKQIFGKIIILADDLFQLEELAHRGQEEHPMINFSHCELREFGYRLRGKLINKWVSLGSEYTTDEKDLAVDVSRKEHIVNTVLGKNILPSYPMTILTVLQTWETNQSNNTATGSYGYLYEELITRALREVSANATDVDTKYTYISRVAYYLFDNEQIGLDEHQLKEVNQEYFRLYRIHFHEEKMLRELETAHILHPVDGIYRFNYKYVYYYFVARYFRENLNNKKEKTKLRNQLRDMVDKVYYEEYANILIFLVYLTKDRELIERIMDNARKIYDEHEPCDLDNHVTFINQMYRETVPLSLPATDLEENRDQYRQKMDEAEEEDEAGQESVSRREEEQLKIKYDKNLADMFKINIALKTLDLMGQVLRNFPGSLLGDVKFQLTQESYRLALRTLRAVFVVAERSLEELRAFYSRLIKERRGIRSEIELARTTDELLIWLTLAAGYGMIKRVSHAVGLEKLNETYRDVLECEGNNISISLIDLSIKLDHFSALPEVEIRSLQKKLRDNRFAYTILRDLVANYMYLFPLDQRTRQSIGDLLDIKISNPKYLDNESKKLKP